MSVDCGHNRRQAPGPGSWIGIRPRSDQPQPTEPARPGHHDTTPRGVEVVVSIEYPQLLLS